MAAKPRPHCSVWTTAVELMTGFTFRDREATASLKLDAHDRVVGNLWPSVAAKLRPHLSQQDGVDIGTEYAVFPWLRSHGPIEA